MTQQCPICGGSQVINLAGRYPVRIFDGPDNQIAHVKTIHSKRYACPECTTPVSPSKMHVVCGAASLASAAFQTNEPAQQMLTEHMQWKAAHEIVDYLLRHELIDFQKNRIGDRTEITAHLAVATPDLLPALRVAIRSERGQ